MFTDTHCHIHEAGQPQSADDPTHALWVRTNDTPNALVDRAAKSGVTRMICVGTTLADSQRAVDFVQHQPNCWASIGLHPHEAKDGQQALDGLAQLLEQGVAGSAQKIVAIGECGLDYFYAHSPKKEQQKALRYQIELALAHDLPLIFHVREAFDDFWPVFDSYQGIRGVLHSFTDSYASFEQGMQRGLHLGFNGIITFTKNADHLQIAKEIPLQKLLLETDAPFLTPTPLRGTVNEPANVRLVAEFLAGLRNEPLKNIAAHTAQNAQTLFNF